MFKWGTEQQKAFDTLKERLTTAPILIYPDFSKPMILMTDASNVAIGAVLGQIGPDGKEHPIAYASRGLKPAEKNYATIELECLALVYGTTKFRTYLWGNKIIAYTDHNPLQYLKNHQDTSSRLMRWALKLQEYDIVINYRRGKANGNADALSRPPIAPNEYWPELSVIENAPLIDVLTIANELLTSLRTITNYDEFRACMREDIEAQQIIEKAKAGSTPYEVQDDIIKYRQQSDALTYIPKKLREIIMLQYHDGTLGGHLSSKKTLSRIRQKYHWPNMVTDIKKWCQDCSVCRTRRNTGKKFRVPLKPMPVAAAPMEMVAMDIHCRPYVMGTP